MAKRKLTIEDNESLTFYQLRKILSLITLEVEEENIPKEIKKFFK